MNLLHARRFYAGLFASAALAAHAQIVQTNYSSSTATMPGNVAISSSDLLQTDLSSASHTGTFYRQDSGYTVTISRLYDGAFGTFGSTGLGGDGNYTVMPGNATITFTFDLSTNTAGYDLSTIRTFASWDDGRDGQGYQVLYSTVSDPSSFTSLYTIANYNPSGLDDPANTTVQLSASSGSLATNVAALRFVFSGVENNGTAYREFDVIGAAAVPEPSTYAALAGVCALIGAALRRRRAR